MNKTPAKKITPVVRSVLANNFSARESYTELIRLVYARFGLNLTSEQMEILSHCPSPEGITRAARKIWQQGELLPSKQTREQRQELQQVYRYEFTPDGTARKVAVV